MKDKFLQFFTGKMSKSIYISIAAAVVCGAVVITSTVIVHNNNQKIDSVLESLSASESVAELSNERLTESVSDAVNTDSSAQVKAQNGEPAGDKALQYLAEYNKLTEEYEAKKAELDKKTIIYIEPAPPQKRTADTHLNAEEFSRKQAEYDAEYLEKMSKWEIEHSKWDAVKRQAEQANKELEELKQQYEKDISSLKQKYGVL